MLGAQLLVDNKTSSIIIKIIIFFQSVESFFILIINTFNFKIIENKGEGGNFLYSRKVRLQEKKLPPHSFKFISKNRGTCRFYDF